MHHEIVCSLAEVYSHIFFVVIQGSETVCVEELTIVYASLNLDQYRANFVDSACSVRQSESRLTTGAKVVMAQYSSHCFS